MWNVISELWPMFVPLGVGVALVVARVYIDEGESR